MSLDFYLEGREVVACPECGHKFTVANGDELFSRNITHNLGRMARAAGIYSELWRPDEIRVEKAADIVEALEDGLTRLRALPEHFRKYDAPNGWGRYEHFVPFVEEVLRACRENPEAAVRASR